MLTQLFQQICATKTSNVHPRRVLLSLIVIIIAGTSCTKTEVCQYCAEDNKWPVANAGADTIIVFPSDSFLLNGTASFDPDGNIVKYEWYAVPVFPFSSASKIGDPNAKQTLVTNLTPGIYRFGLKTTDDKGAYSYDTLTIQFEDIHYPPHQIGFYPWPYSGLSWNPGTTGFTTVGPLQDWQLNIAPEDNDGTKWKVQLVQKSTNTAVFLPYVKYDQITEASPSVFYTISDLVSPGPGEIPTGSIYVSAKLARPSNIDFSEKVDVVLYLKF
jgi:K319-like protein